MTLATQADFARDIGVVRSRVTALKNAGRLVMEGDRVDVEKSKVLIEATRDGRRDHQSPRRGGEGEQLGEQETVPEGGNVRRIDAQARKEHLAAELLQIDLDERRGKLLVADQVISFIADAATTFRTRLESFPDLLAPQLAATADEQQVRAILADHIEIALTEMSSRFAEMAR